MTKTLLRFHRTEHHATCAWCRTDFATIGDLVDHADSGHGSGIGLRRGFVTARSGWGNGSAAVAAPVVATAARAA